MRSKKMMLLIAYFTFAVGGCATEVLLTEALIPEPGTPADTAAITALAVSPSSGTLRQGEALRLTPQLTWRGTSHAVPLSWTSSNTQVASVGSDGMVRGVKPGTARVTVGAEGFTANANLTVLDTTTVTNPPPPPPPAGSALPAFPGAQGAGTSTVAGRGGQVLRVTNLNDSGEGSLRWAVTQTGPRVVVFEVSGTIRLLSELKISSPFITVAGQTAPSPGISLRGSTVLIATHDVVVQHIRNRVGDDAGGSAGNKRDGFQIMGSSIYNVVLDHVSASWSIDELLSSYTLRDVTVSNSIWAEGLNRSIHPDGAHSKGVFIAEGTQKYTFIGNLVAHNLDRNPAIKGNTSAMIVNNVIYDWGNGGATPIWDSSSDPTGKPSVAAIVGNVYLPGPSTPSDGIPVKIHDTVAPGSKVYLFDNVWSKATSNPWSIAEIESLPFDPKATSAPLWDASITTRPGNQVEAWVLSNAGARPADRDAVDSRVVAQVRARNGRIIDSPSQVGGWPELALNRRTLTIPANPNGDADGDGYTNLEEWLHTFAAQVEGRTGG